MEAGLQCPICSDIFQNPHILNCGHSYCSLCIRKHFDKTLNSSASHDQCPTCRCKSDSSHLIPNRVLGNVVLAYAAVRNHLLNHLSADAEGSSKTLPLARQLSSPTSNIIKISSDLRQLPHLIFHGKPKKYVRDAIDRLCSITNVKLNLDNVDQDDLERFYRELVHLNNSQLESSDPMSFRSIVKEVNKKELIRRTEALKASRNVSNASKAGYDEKVTNNRLSLSILTYLTSQASSKKTTVLFNSFTAVFLTK